MLAWWGAVRGGFVAVPINTAYKGQYLRHQLARLRGQRADRAAEPPRPVRGDRRRPAGGRATWWSSTTTRRLGGGCPAGTAAPHGWADLLAVGRDDAVGDDPARRPRHVRLHRRHHRPVEGLHAQPQLPRGRWPARSAICWGRTADDVRVDAAAAVPLQRASSPPCSAPLIFGGRSAIYRRFSVSQLLAGDEPDRRHHHLDARHDGVPAGPRRRPTRRCRGPGAPEANTSLRLIGAAPMPVEVDNIIKERFGLAHLQRRLRRDRGEPHLLAAAGRARTSPTPPASSTTSTSTCGSSTTTTTSCRRGTDGEIVIRPKRPHVMFEGYWGRPEATVETSRNWWYHTGDIGRIDEDGFLFFVDRKADYLRRRGENISSFEVERILMGHGALADVVVHAVPSEHDRGRPQDHRDARGGGDAHRGGAVPLVRSTSCRTSRCPATSSSAPSCPAARSAGCSSASCATRASPPPPGTSRRPASPTRSADGSPCHRGTRRARACWPTSTGSARSLRPSGSRSSTRGARRARSDGTIRSTAARPACRSATSSWPDWATSTCCSPRDSTLSRSPPLRGRDGPRSSTCRSRTWAPSPPTGPTSRSSRPGRASTRELASVVQPMYADPTSPAARLHDDQRLVAGQRHRVRAARPARVLGGAHVVDDDPRAAWWSRRPPSPA